MIVKKDYVIIYYVCMRCFRILSFSLRASPVLREIEMLLYFALYALC
jgi:hypothetical protein